jgi:hypothetical protein
MATALPIIASDFPLWREIVGDSRCALFVDPTDPGASPKPLITSCRIRKKRKRWAAGDVIWSSTRYNWRSEEIKLLALYSRLVPRRFPKKTAVSSVIFMELPVVTVIIPCRNEAKFIEACLKSVAANDYPRERLEVLVMDGMSEDGTREMVDAFAKDHPFLRRIDNPKKITPTALNIGIKTPGAN